jgi:hypothetical protein
LLDERRRKKGTFGEAMTRKEFDEKNHYCKAKEKAKEKCETCKFVFIVKANPACYIMPKNNEFSNTINDLYVCDLWEKV